MGECEVSRSSGWCGHLVAVAVVGDRAGVSLVVAGRLSVTAAEVAGRLSVTAADLSSY
jgi:hypothetical protein